MKIKDKIIQSLIDLEDKLLNIKSDWFIIGSSAMILSGIRIENTSDIDILTTNEGSDEFQDSLREYMEINPLTKENDLFRSNFARFNYPLINIEVMGELQINKGTKWETVTVTDFDEISVGNLMVKIPTKGEQKRLLQLFGRGKDLKRIDLFD